MKEKCLTLIKNIFVQKNWLPNDFGLMNGQAGIAMFLYFYSKIMQDKKAEKTADKIIDTLWTYQLYEMSPNFYSGTTGIVWAINHLADYEFLDLNEEQFIRTTIYKVIQQKFETPTQIDLNSSLFSNGLFLLKQIKNEESTSEYSVKENLIYQVDECERILLGTAYIQICNPPLSLTLLNSIFYFLIEVHKQKLYPCKTQKLLQLFPSFTDKIYSSDSFSEVITFQRLLFSLKDINFSMMSKFDMEALNTYIAKLIPKGKIAIVSELSKAGIYSLLYDNHQLFNDCFLRLIQHDSSLWQQISQVLEEIKHKGIAINNLFGLGYGLLFFENEYTNAIIQQYEK